MKNIQSLIISILFFSSSLIAQPTIQWQKSFGGTANEKANSIQQTSDGGYISVGHSFSNDGDVTGNHGNNDYWVVKLNASGTLQWQKSLGGTGFEYAYSIQQTSDGGYIISGRSSSNDGDVTGNHGSYDFWIVKLFSTGSIEWQKSLGGTGDEGAWSIIQTQDGGYIVSGYSSSNDGDVDGNHGGRDYWIVKINSSGNILWQKSFGGSLEDGGLPIEQTSDSGYIVAGYTYSNDGDVSGNHGDRDFWVVKINSTGIIQWQKTLGGTGDDEAYSIIQSMDGGYVVTGSSNSNDGDITNNHSDYDFWIAKLNSNGIPQWQNSFGGTAIDWSSSVRQTPDSGFIIAAYSNSLNGDLTQNFGDNDFWIVKLFSNGNLQWQKSFGGTLSDVPYSIEQTNDGGFIVGGFSGSNDNDVTLNQGGIDYWIVKLNPIINDIEEVNYNSEISIYPNPASSELTITSLQQSINTIAVFDLMGKTVTSFGFGVSGSLNLKSKIIRLKSLSPGVYFIKLQLHDGSWEVRRFVKQ